MKIKQDVKNHLMSSACWHPYLEGEMAESLILMYFMPMVGMSFPYLFPSNYLSFSCSYLYLKEIYFPGFFLTGFRYIQPMRIIRGRYRGGRRGKDSFAFFGMFFVALDTFSHQVNFCQVILAPGHTSIIFISPSLSYLRQ